MSVPALELACSMTHAAWRRGRRLGLLEGFLVGVVVGVVAVALWAHHG